MLGSGMHMMIAKLLQPCRQGLYLGTAMEVCIVFTNLKTGAHNSVALHQKSSALRHLMLVSGLTQSWGPRAIVHVQHEIPGILKSFSGHGQQYVVACNAICTRQAGQPTI